MNTHDKVSVEGVLKNLGFEGLTPMQQDTMRAYEVRKDLVLLSPTGTGKTLAYLLPLVRHLEGTGQVQAVVLVPSRELAQQTEAVFRRMGTPFRALACYGGRPAMDEHRAMNSLHPEVIIGTPGRMLDHLDKGNFAAEGVRTLVIDEFDKSLELGFHDQMQQVIQSLPALRKRVLLSATDAEEIPRFAGLGDGSRVIKLNYADSAPADRLRLYVVASPQKDKLETLYRLLCTLGVQHTLVFVNYRESVERVGDYLRSLRFPCDCFHGGMEQEDRERTLYKFANGSCPVLVSTDLAARGLDIEGIENVVHYHLPLGEEAFTHRNGRTARWDAQGATYLILGPEERLPDYVPEGGAERLALPAEVPAPPKPQWTTLYVGRGKKDKVNKVDIAGFFYKKGGLQAGDMGRIDVRDHHAFVAVRASKVRQLLKLISGEKIKGQKTLIEEAK